MRTIAHRGHDRCAQASLATCAEQAPLPPCTWRLAGESLLIELPELLAVPPGRAGEKNAPPGPRFA